MSTASTLAELLGPGLPLAWLLAAVFALALLVKALMDFTPPAGDKVAPEPQGASGTS